MKTTVIFNAKGGVGKTITTINMAAELAAQGYRVLAVDADPQMNLTRFFGAGKPADADGPYATIYDVLEQGAPSYLPNLLRPTQFDGVACIPANMDLVLADVRALHERKLDLMAIRHLATMITEDDAADFMLIDTPPSFTAATTAALAAADDVIIPIKLDAFSLSGVEELLRQITGMREINPALRIAGVLVTQYDGTTVARETADALRESAIPVFGTPITRSTAVDRSTFVRRALRDLPGTYAKLLSEQYAEVVDEYLKGGKSNG